MARRINSTRKMKSHTRKKFLTSSQVYALKAVFGDGWMMLSPKAIEVALATMGK